MQLSFDLAPMARRFDPSTSHDAATRAKALQAAPNWRFKDISGQRFERLVVVSRAENNGTRAAWLCACDCGKTSVVVGRQLRSGMTRSCGCLMNESRKVAGGANFRHGLTYSRVWETWCSMRRRCEKPSHKSYKDYGARGIRVCDRWQSFNNFLADMGDRPAGMTLDRWPDQTGNYEPGNCRWATSKQQSRNRRSNVALVAFGESKLLIEWCEDPRCVASEAALAKRIAAGWPPEEALTRPKYATRNLTMAARDALNLERMGLAKPTGRKVPSTSGRDEREWVVL